MSARKQIDEMMIKENFLGKIAKFFINRFEMAILVIILIIVLGLTSVLLLPKESLPEIIFPRILVQTTYPGASPEDVENLVSVKIENKIKDLDDVDEISSDSSFGYSQVILSFSEGVDIDQKKIVLDNLLSSIEFPEGVLETQSAILSTSELPLMNFSISGNYSVFTLSSIANRLKEGISGLSGVESVTIAGDLDRQIHIIIDETKMIEYGVTANDLRSALADLNIGYPVGEVDLGGIRYNLRIDEKVNTVSEIENTLIRTAAGKTPFIRDVAKVVDTSEEITSFSRTYDSLSVDESTTPSIFLEIIRENKSDVVGTSELIKTYLNQEKGNLYPDDIKVNISFDSAINVKNDLNNIQSSAVSGLIVVVLVLFLFIGFREALIVSVTIPLSLLITLGVLNVFGITLNTFAILGLIVALGLLVDNSIIVMENIDRVRRKGLSSFDAARFGTNQVGYPIFASSLTTIAAFFPLAILPGVIGSFIETIPRTIIFAIAASLIVSISITPSIYSRIMKFKEESGVEKKYSQYIKVVLIASLSYYAFSDGGRQWVIGLVAGIIFGLLMFLKERSGSERKFEEGFLVESYGRLMEAIVSSRPKMVIVLFAAISILVISIALIPLGILKIAFFPTNEPSNISIIVDTPGGTTLSQTSEITSRVEEVLILDANIESFNTTIGGNEIDRAIINVTLIDSDSMLSDGFDVVDQIEQRLRVIPGAKIIVEGLSSGGPPVGKPIRIDLVGNDLETSRDLAEDYVDVLEKIPGVYNVDLSVKEGVPQIMIDILEKKAKMMGLSPAGISNQLRTKLEGMKITTIQVGEEEIEVMMMLDQNFYQSIESLNAIYIDTPTGHRLPLAAVAVLTEEKGVSSIRRLDRDRILYIEADLKTGYNINDVVDTFNDERKQLIVPQGISVNLGGDVAGIQENFLSLFQSMILAVFLVFIILTIQFGSVTQPFVILLTIPMALIGVIAGLIITGNEFGFYAFMGLIALVGIAVNDAIVLIDYMNYLRSVGRPMKEAVVEAGRTRFNPVLATSLTTIGGVLPLAFKEIYYEQFSFSLIFGLLVTTVLTLIYIPIIYSVIEGLFKSNTSTERGVS
jgi:HAE1 family hydrophobic/amphiphilic exporter-1